MIFPFQAALAPYTPTSGPARGTPPFTLLLQGLLFRWETIGVVVVHAPGRSRNHWSTVSATTPNITCAITFAAPRTRS